MYYNVRIAYDHNLPVSVVLFLLKKNLSSCPYNLVQSTCIQILPRSELLRHSTEHDLSVIHVLTIERKSEIPPATILFVGRVKIDDMQYASCKDGLIRTCMEDQVTDTGNAKRRNCRV